MAIKQTKTPAPETEVEAPVKQPVVFSNAKILKLTGYAHRRDLLSVLLEDGKEYTKDQVDSLIEDFMKGKVK